MCKPRFTTLLLRELHVRVIQTTASVMPERSKPPNLALKRSSKSLVSPLLHIFPMEINVFYVDRSTTTMPNHWVSFFSTFTAEIVHLLNAYEAC